MAIKYRPPRGTKDFLPDQSTTIAFLERKAREVFTKYGYKEVRLPSIANMDIFKKGLGDNTDIVEKQIFKIEGKENICLRPEATAQIVRSYIENGLVQQKLFKAFYIGSMFRGERPQKGRLRQFNHIGAEAIGIKSVFLDAEIIKLARELLISFGVEDFQIQINSLGCRKDKENLNRMLKNKLANKIDSLCQDCRRRFSHNVLRILDCKKKQCKKAVQDLKIGNSYLCRDCSDYFKKLVSLLDAEGIKYKITPTLVRGLDYYTDIVFEFVSSSLGAQDAVGAGGRYDNLVKNLGGKGNPACGFALGLERIMLLKKSLNTVFPEVFLAFVSPSLASRAFQILNLLRESGISADMDFGEGSLKSQLRYCQKLNSKYAVIVGDEELKKQSVILRDMRFSSQEVVKISDLVEIIKEKDKE